MPLVDIYARLDGQGKARRGFLEIPVAVRLLEPGGAELRGSPVVVYGVKTFWNFLSECSDATIRQVDLLIDLLAIEGKGKCYGIFLEERALAALLSGEMEWRPIARVKRASVWGPS